MVVGLGWLEGGRLEENKLEDCSETTFEKKFPPPKPQASSSRGSNFSSLERSKDNR